MFKHTNLYMRIQCLLKVKQHYVFFLCCIIIIDMFVKVLSAFLKHSCLEIWIMGNINKTKKFCLVFPSKLIWGYSTHQYYVRNQLEHLVSSVKQFYECYLPIGSVCWSSRVKLHYITLIAGRLSTKCSNLNTLIYL